MDAAFSGDTDADGEGDVCLYELMDPSTGVVYYVNSETGESSWMPPKWVDIYDDNTGYFYYSNTQVMYYVACMYSCIYCQYSGGFAFPCGLAYSSM